MSSKYTLQNGKKIWIADTPLGTGAEGAVHSIVRPKEYKHGVAKILYPQKRTSERRKKITYLVENPPASTRDVNGHNFIIWPQMMLFDQSEFVGFIMPQAEGIDMDNLCLPNLKPELGNVWKKFDRKNPEAIRLRLILCSNLAKAVNAIHSTGHYVIGDLKPENIKVKSNGWVSIIDLDSCQISENGNVLFHSQMNTPKYNPPDQTNTVKDASWDLFIIGVIFYELLCGIHPFTGTSLAPYDQYNTPDQKIKHGLFPFGSKGQYFKVIPAPHQEFRSLPKIIQKLFLECFDYGIYTPQKRPKASDWVAFLTSKPKVVFFKTSRETIIEGVEITLSWEIQGAEEIEINGGIGYVENTGSVTLKPKANQHFKLLARNLFGISKKEVEIKTFPTPVLESLIVPAPDFSNRITLKPIAISLPKIDLSIKPENTSLKKPILPSTLLHKTDIRPKYPKKSRTNSLSKIFQVFRQKLNL